ncbi:MAG: hypothetical protein JSV33_04840 [bacterium]|nr:MAG: hypothetical protein JSV33_04840 [bacterium]
MKSRKSMNIIGFFIISAMILLLFLPACRREAEPLDRNKAPETYLTSSPPDTTETDYRVHLYWRGVDNDGIVTRYIWYISDTLLTLDPENEPEQELLDWNPAERISDYLVGRFTEKTDSIFIFTGYEARTGALVNRQAFHIAAIDDGGKIDPNPARLQFLARVKGVPEVGFWTIIDGVEKPFDPNDLDTIPMFTPFSIRFSAHTVNNYITGYRWIYEGTVYPDFNNDGVADWHVPVLDPPETVQVDLSNTGDEALPDGDFYFRVIARDEAGALSEANIITGEGICNVVLNHDPDTRVLRAINYYKPLSSGEWESREIDFYDGLPDTMPYNSLVWFEYLGWDDPDDIPTLQYQNPPRPIRFQFRFKRSTAAGLATKLSPWYPIGGAEDTNPFADLEDERRDIDSTTIRVGTFDYMFIVRSFDEQYRSDGTPDTVRFVGNYHPTVDDVKIGFWDPTQFRQMGRKVFREIEGDTLYIGWRGLTIKEERGDTCSLDTFITNLDTETISKYFRFVLLGSGHDDERDPIDPEPSGVKGWQYHMTAIDNPPERQFTMRKERDWLFDFETNAMVHEIPIVFNVPFAHALSDSIVNDPPFYFGAQLLEVVGIDIRDNEIFEEGIRGISPQFRGDTLYAPGGWIKLDYQLANYARRDTFRTNLYIKMVF